MRTTPPHVKIQRAKAIVDNEGRKVLMLCCSCRKEKYILEGLYVCEECRSVKKHKRR